MRLLTLLTTALLISGLTACNNNKPTADEEPGGMDTIPPNSVQDGTKEDADEIYITLTDTLNKRVENFTNNADPAKVKLYQEGVDEVAASGILDKAKNVGDAAPNFTLPNAEGKMVTLNDQLKNGPVILTWYRGGWCPYCNIQLAYMQQYLPKFKAEGASLIAISPELPDSSLSTKEKNELEFEVLSDLDNKVAKEYGIVFELHSEVAKAYSNFFNWNDYYGNQGDELPLAATYIIRPDGTIGYAFLSPDYRERAEPEELVEILHMKYY